MAQGKLKLSRCRRVAVKDSLGELSSMFGSSAFSVANVELLFGPALIENPPLTAGWIVHSQYISFLKGLTGWKRISLILFPLRIHYAQLSSSHGAPVFKSKVWHPTFSGPGNLLLYAPCNYSGNRFSGIVHVSLF